MDLDTGRIAERVSSLLGIRAVVHDGDTWQVDAEGRGLSIGAGFYARFGFRGELLEIAILHDLWSTLGLARAHPARTRRRITIATERPDLEPLLQVADQLQGAGELLSSFPGFRHPLTEATKQRTPRDLRQLAWPDQLLISVLRLGLTGRNDTLVDEPVRAELAEISSELLRAAMNPARASTAIGKGAPRTTTHGLRVHERLLGLLIPPTERLTRAQAAEHGLATGIEGAEDSVDAELDITSTSSRSDATIDEQEQERARAASQIDTSEGADLFEAQQAAQVTAILETPLPVTNPVVLDALAATETAGQQGGSEQLGHGSADAARTAVNLSRYRERLERFASEIEDMREVWRDVIHERISTRRTASRLPHAFGDDLHRESLPRAVAEALAGVPRPRAYEQLEIDYREQDGSGNTDYVFLIDRSGSMRPAAQAAADAVLVMMEGLAGVAREVAELERATGTQAHLDIRTALIVFDSEVTVVKPLAATLDDLSRARLYNVMRSTGGGTNDAAALQAAASELRGSTGERQRIVIVVTDGESSDEPRARIALDALRAVGVRVYGVGVASEEVVRRFAPDGTRVDDPRDIARVMGRLVTQQR